VTVVITVPHQAEPWKVSGSAFRLLATEVGHLTADFDFMVRAEALNGLHLEMEASPEREREAALLAEAARSLRARLLADPAPGDWELSLAQYLPVLEMWMEGLSASEV
jgi:hypothetical protein